MQKEADKNEKKRMQWGQQANPSNPNGKSEERAVKPQVEVIPERVNSKPPSFPSSAGSRPH